MKHICLFFQIHQPFRYRRYRFFDIGNDHYYYDDYANESVMRRMASRCYLPANQLLLKLAKRYQGKFKVAFSLTGVALDQFELYAPEVLNSFKELAQTGCVEFLSETYSHSLVALRDADLFQTQVKKHDERIRQLFGQQPRVFRNTEMIYSDQIGAEVAKMGYRAILAEGAKHVLGWKSPNFLYVNAIQPRLRVLMRNYQLSDDIGIRFSNSNWSEYPLTADKFMGWLQNLDAREELVNLFMGYDVFGEKQPPESGIFDFFESWVALLTESEHWEFATPSEVVDILQPVSAVSVPTPISWADEERDLTPWLGNEMQNEALGKLYEMTARMQLCRDEALKKDWDYLLVSDHFYYMSTKHRTTGGAAHSINPFDSPYEAFINYMNVLSDFKMRLNAHVPETPEESEIAVLKKVIDEKDKRLKKLEADLVRLQKQQRRIARRG